LRPWEESPENADQLTLRRLREGGSDMTQPMEIDFHVAAPDQKAAESIATAARRLKYVSKVYRSEDCSLPWTCQCSRVMIASYENIVRTQAELLVVAEPFGGYPDGWGTFGNVSQLGVNAMTRKAVKKAAKQPAKPKSTRPTSNDSPARLIDERITALADWRGKTLAEVRKLILAADPAIVEEWKWNNPVWSHEGILCTGEAYKQVVKLTFAKGASLPDPAGLLNSSLEGNTRRAIDLRESETLNAKAFTALIRAAIKHNAGKEKQPAKPASTTKASKSKTSSKTAAPVKLLSGGNPQIAKADGDAPVQAFIAAMPGWKQDVGRRLDALITRTLPNVRKAVRWNTPFYGIEGQGWFLGFHCITKYVKVAFMSGASLDPPPPIASKQDAVRYFHIFENDVWDEEQLVSWIKQAAKLPGEKMF
jgi:regulator of RNase E activity RraB